MRPRPRRLNDAALFGAGLLLGNPDSRRYLVGLWRHPWTRQARDRVGDLLRERLSASRTRIPRTQAQPAAPVAAPGHTHDDDAPMGVVGGRESLP